MQYLLIASLALISLVLVATTVSVKPAQNKKGNSVSPTQNISPIPSPILSESAQSGPDTSDSEWKYPNSTRIDLGSGNYYYKSSDDPTVITNWYKTKIGDMHLNMQTFVTNTVNGEVKNKLQASNFSRFISVEVQKKPSEDSTRITVKYTVE